MPRAPAYVWNGRAARYRDPLTGRFVPRADVRRWLDRDIQASQTRIRLVSDELRAGTITLAEWQAVMREEIKRTQLASEMLLRGGRDQMTPADFGRVGAKVRDQYRFLDRFTDELRRGLVRTDGTFLNRAAMYIASARTSFHERQSEQLATLGYTEERNILHPAEHCDGCLDETAKGWSDIGTLTPVGQRTCRGNDRCSIEYR